MPRFQSGTMVTSVNSPFCLEREISDQGGMASIYEATVIDNEIRERNGKRVALKIARTGEDNDDLFETFLRRETDLLTKLRHPGVVRVFPIRQGSKWRNVARATNLPGEPFYFAMELLGRNLKEIITDRRFSLPWRVEVLYQVAVTLDFVHVCGLVHRDLKPENIMFRGEVSPKAIPQVVLIDFGLGEKRYRPGDVQAATLSHSSPERILAFQQRTTQIQHPDKVDVWALGVVAYELLTGLYPFGEMNSRTELTDRILYKQPFEMRDVPPNLRRLVEATLAKNPERRPTMQEVVERLETDVEYMPPRI
ncbi:MAG: serine/threonine protein kinase [Anaerolineae bacterium]|nr:serine/threonine protein kinase [Anaerolineae bacterium]MDW8171940.1 serine/threonine-protein kinase [Anaerolineae bacterium]